jgi:hypothetical protein
MIAEAQKYRGVACVSCRQPIPLPSKAAQRDAKFREQESPDAVVPMFTLRCNACEREGLYAPLEVIDFEGVPKGRRVRRASASS